MVIAMVSDISIVDNNASGMDKGLVPTVVFMDLKKTFDTHEQGILVKKLEYGRLSNINIA